MKFRVEWLAEYLPGPVPGVGELRSQLTSCGFIVEGVEGSGAEAVLDIDITPNRPDAMSHRGLALEAAVVLDRPFVDPHAGVAPEETGPPAESLATVTIDEPSLCSRYSARVIEGIAMGPASERTRERLEAIGAKPISGPVDATNLVLWDMGQPEHAFDLDKLAKGPDGRPVIVVRRARDGEKLVTLDGVERTLTPEILVIADAERAVGLAGVMGGLDTAISDSTRRVLLESAHFEASAVRHAARVLGMHTDASHRFERGSDRTATVVALDRCARRILADCGGSVARGVIDAVARPATPRTIRLRFSRVGHVLGMEVPLPRCLAILRALGIACVEADGLITATIPAARVDLVDEIDLVEEVIRHVGYDALPETMPHAFVPTWTDPRLAREERIRDILAGAGFVETCTYSFVSAAENAPFETLAPGDRVRLQNPLGEPFEVLRATPISGLLKAAQHNVRHGSPDLALFEVGRSYGRNGAAPRESRRASILLHGVRTRHFDEGARIADTFDGSGAVAAVFGGLGAAAPRFEPLSASFLAPGRGASVTAGGRQVGWVGVLSSSLAAAYDLQDPVVAELDVEALPEVTPPTSVEMPPRFPGSDIDLTVTHRLALPFADLEAAGRTSAPAELQGIDVTSRYRGQGVPEGFVKTTLHLVFLSRERSLSREEVNTWRDQAAERLLALGETKVDGYPPPVKES